MATLTYTSMVEAAVPSLSETIIVNMPLSLGVAVSPSWTTTVNVELYVGRTLVTVLEVGVIVQAAGGGETVESISTSYVSIEEPLLWIVKVKFIDSPGVRIMWGMSTSSSISESALLNCASGVALASSIIPTKTNARMESCDMGPMLARCYQHLSESAM